MDGFGLVLAANLLGGTAQMEATLEEACSRQPPHISAVLEISLVGQTGFDRTSCQVSLYKFQRWQFDLIFIDATFCLQPKTKIGNDDESQP
mgnify:CR=1 FL=1